MGNREVDPNDSSVAFGRDEALFTYSMARSVDPPSDRSIGEAAEDAVRTAKRQQDRPDVDVSIATSALVEAVVSTDFPEGFNYVIDKG